MNKFFVVVVFLAACAAPDVFRTSQGLHVARYFSGPSPSEIESVASLAETSGLCNPGELKEIEVKIYPVSELFGSNDPLSKTSGIARNKEVVIAGKSDFSCRTLLHELAHACRRVRGLGESDHDDRNIWSVRKQLNSDYSKEVANICP